MTREISGTKDTRKRKGRPGKVGGSAPFEPTNAERRMVQVLTATGWTRAQIAETVRGGINPETLAKYFADDLERGKSMVMSGVTGKAFELAMAGDGAMLRYILGCKGGWKYGQELSGPNGGPIQVTHRPDLRHLTGDELQALKIMAEKTRRIPDASNTATAQ